MSENIHTPSYCEKLKLDSDCDATFDSWLPKTMHSWDNWPVEHASIYLSLFS